MGLIKNLRILNEMAVEERKMAYLTNAFKTFTAYAPSFSTYAGGVYEMALTRSAIHALANQISKANPVVKGDKYKSIESILKNRPNALMTGQQFLYKWATIFYAENTCLIVPIYEDRTGGKIIGYWPLSAKGAEVVSSGGTQYIKYKQPTGDGSSVDAIMELSRVGITRRHYYSSDYFGESNNALNSTMNLLYTQEQGIIEGVKTSNTLRFLMKLSNVMSTKEKIKEQVEIVKDINFGSANNNGLFVYDNRFSEAKQIDSKPMVVDADQAKVIQENVHSYFGTFNEFIQNKFSETQWDSVYEGNIEPSLIQLSQVLTRMTFNEQDVDRDSFIFFETSMLQYASNKTKLEIVTSLFDRGFCTHNDGRRVFNMADIDGGDKYFIRREYVEVNKLGNVTGLNTPKEGDPLEGAKTI